MTETWASKWRISERLGGGGQGETHLAEHLEVPTVRGAIKRLRKQNDQKARGRMRREVAALRELAAKGGSVPRVLDDNTALAEDPSAELFVVMDFVDGPTLKKLVNDRHCLDVETSMQFILSLGRTIHIAHSLPILHRDLKPENVIVRNADAFDLVILDYGLSFNANDEDLTEVGEQIKNGFLALPEMNTPGGSRRDHRSDVTALCGLLYFCLTGHIPGHLQDGNGMMPHMRPGFTPRDAHSDERVGLLEGMFTKGFSPAISNRFQSIEEFLVSLNGVVKSSRTVDESDPTQLARSIAADLPPKHRKTQIAAFRREAESIFSFINAEFHQYSSGIAPFRLGFGTPNLAAAGLQPSRLGTGKQIGSLQIPAGFELVATSPWSIPLSVDNYGKQLHCFFVVTARGEQCVLSVGEYELVRSKHMFQPLELPKHIALREIARYEGQTLSIQNLVAIWIREWLTTQMRVFKSEMIGK